MQQLQTTSSQKFRSHRDFQRILSGLRISFQKKLGFRSFCSERPSLCQAPRRARVVKC